ncbi:sigma factor-like helix-turn-helix DNA-binding protein [Pseudomonas huanghezhanensis]|uniref:sigma factor-like helix-turn-helix DNA-binding protein n=1 Tax=Pseudomonas huanghezhanensis TaxID=3002903 RepID=UPI002286988A|nr:sigma factor-like helix-turn-helix DNA-binding protein [Pseudomonas sp. BSw22131]
MTGQSASLLPLSTQQPDMPLRPESDELRRRIQTLPRRTQQVFLLSRLDRLPYADIAHWLDISTAAVERAMVRVFESCAAPQPSDVNEAASVQAQRWYVHLQSPHATASQRIEFRHWLDADLSHLRAFEGAEWLWRQLEAPSAVLGASGWHRRKRRVYIGWLLLTAFLCSLLMTAEAISALA